MKRLCTAARRALGALRLWIRATLIEEDIAELQRRARRHREVAAPDVQEAVDRINASRSCDRDGGVARWR